MIWVYRILMFLIQVALKLCQPFLNKKIMYFYQNQGKLFKNSNPDSSPLWIHATSGELEYAIPLIEELSKNFSHIPLLVTHSSLSSKNNLDQLPVAMTGVIPLDSYYDVSNFLNLVRPRALLISRTEIWPELIHQLHEREIPSFLFSATFAPGSKKMGLFSRLFISQALTQMNKVFVVSRDDKQNAEKLFSELKVEALGDTRYDRVADKLSKPAPISLPTHNQILVLGSIWHEDAKIFLPILVDLKKLGWKIIWTPHEIHSDEILGLEGQFKAMGLNSQRLSQNPDTHLWEKNDILIIDQVGLLAYLYTLARISFVGGSFRQQVHSVMEPLGAHSPVLVGPYYLNNREAIEFERLGCVKVARTSSELLSQIQNLDRDYDKITQLLKIEIKNRRGATHKLVQALRERKIF